MSLAESSEPPVAYLGPEGTFSHFVTRNRYSGRRLVPFSSVDEVFDFVEKEKESEAVVPIENSSGGIITPTVDRIIAGSNELYIREELSVNVCLALLGRDGDKVEKIFSHFAPLHHCASWLNEHYPQAEQITAPSTVVAVQRAVGETGAAALAPLENSERFDLDVLHYPVESQVENVTQFFVIGHQRASTSSDSMKTSLVAELKDGAGTLCGFLKPFSDAEVNLKRIESRPILGSPNTYRFFVEIEGCASEPKVSEAIASAGQAATRLRNVGSYPIGAKYQS